MALHESYENSQLERQKDLDYLSKGVDFGKDQEDLRNMFGFKKFQSPETQVVDLKGGNYYKEGVDSSEETPFPSQDTLFDMEYSGTLNEILGNDSYNTLPYIRKLFIEEGYSIIEAIQEAINGLPNENKILEQVENEFGYEYSFSESILDNAKNNLTRDLDITDQELENRLTDQSEKENNRQRGMDLFYNEELIINFIEKKEISQDMYSLKMEFFHDDTIQENLSNILENFVIDLEGDSLQEIIENYGDEGKNILARALNFAFELEIGEVLEGKNNFDEKRIKVILEELRSGDPFEKLEKFMELKYIVDTAEGRGGKQQDILFRKVNTIKDKLSLDKQEFLDTMILLMIESRQNNNEKLLENTLQQIRDMRDQWKKESGVGEGEVFGVTVLDTLLGEKDQNSKGLEED